MMAEESTHTHTRRKTKSPQSPEPRSPEQNQNLWGTWNQHRGETAGSRDGQVTGAAGMCLRKQQEDGEEERQTDEKVTSVRSDPPGPDQSEASVAASRAAH